MHHIRYSPRHSTPHGTQPAAEGQHSISHGTQPAVDRWHPPTTRGTPCGVWTIPELHGEQHSVDSHWVRNDLAATLWCRIEPPPSLRSHQPCMHLHPANRQIKKPAGTQTDPGRSADADYVAGRAAWRPRQQHPRDAITSAAPPRPRPRPPARPCPRPRGLKALTARRCRRS